MSRASRRRKTALTLTTGAVAAGLALTGPALGAFASSASGPVSVSTAETVKAQLSASGGLDKAYLFTQIAATGNGTVSLADPTSTKALRNLDGWGAPKVEGGKAVYDFTVNGSKQFRTIADFTNPLPVSVEVTYTLDGKPISADQLAGRSGTLEVSYHVKNVSEKPTEISYTDGHGKPVTETIPLVTPLVGQLTVDLPASFGAVSSDRADVAGDGHGGHLLAWTMVLFSPIGETDQSFGFTAKVSHLALPSSHVQVLPVEPQRHPELLFGQHGFESGAKTGQELTAGAVQIDDNLLKLRDGAAQLLTGLTQLSDGAASLHQGLAGQALPGAHQLAAGLAVGVPKAISGSAQLSDGVAQAATGAAQVSAGSAQLAAGLDQLKAAGPALTAGAGQLQANVPALIQGAKGLAAGSTSFQAGADQLLLAFRNPGHADLIQGSQQLSLGLGLVAAGLDQLASTSSGIPAALTGAGKLSDAVKKAILPALGDPAGTCNQAAPTVLPCLGQVVTSTTAGLPAAQGGVQALLTAVTKNPAATSAAGDPGLRRAVELVKLGLDGAVATGGDIDKLEAAITATPDCGPVCKATVHALLQTGAPGVTSLRASTQAAATALQGVLAGIGDPASPGAQTLIGGLQAVAGGLGQAVTALAQIQSGLSTDLRGGLVQVDAGLDQLVTGLTAAVSGVSQLAPGAHAADQGAAQLTDGLSQAADGVVQLHDGAGQFATGADQFATGAGQYAAGASQFAAGASQVSGGVGAAVTGSKTLAAGAKQLSDGLTGQLAPGAKELAAKLGDLKAAQTGAETLAAGLGDATTGAQQLADGLVQAKQGDQQIVDGAGQLREQGSQVLVGKGEEAAVSYGKELAIMQALNKKAADGALPYGAPANSTANRAAYDLTIAGIGGSGGASSTTRGAAAVVVFAGGAGLAGLLRRRWSAL